MSKPVRSLSSREVSNGVWYACLETCCAASSNSARETIGDDPTWEGMVVPQGKAAAKGRRDEAAAKGGARLACNAPAAFLRSGAGGVFAAETGFKLASNPDTVRAPDVAFIAKDRLPSRDTRGYPALAPDLVVEVLSPDDRAGEDANSRSLRSAQGRLLRSAQGRPPARSPCCR